MGQLDHHSAQIAQGFLEALHVGHLDIVSMKALVCIYVEWPGMDKAIKKWVQLCQPWQELYPVMPQVPVHHFTHQPMDKSSEWCAPLRTLSIGSYQEIGICDWPVSSSSNTSCCRLVQDKAHLMYWSLTILLDRLHLDLTTDHPLQ